MLMSLQVIEWNDLSEMPGADYKSVDSAMTIGVFDGVHLGHQELIKRIVQQGPNPTIVTFRENPKKFFSPETYEGDIYTLNQKLTVFGQLGISRVILIDFSPKFSKLTGTEFLGLLEKWGKMIFLAIGSNFRCGYRKGTDVNDIKEMNIRKGIPTELIKTVKVADSFVSSSRIKSAINSGNLIQASVLLGRNLELDLTGIQPIDHKTEGFVYDPGAVNRIVPANGKYPVFINPGRIRGRAITENGKVYLQKTIGQVDSLEFI